MKKLVLIFAAVIATILPTLAAEASAQAIADSLSVRLGQVVSPNAAALVAGTFIYKGFANGNNIRKNINDLSQDLKKVRDVIAQQK